MLGADLVDARKKDGELVLRPVTKDVRTEAFRFAERYLATVKANVGAKREAVDDALDDIDADAAAGTRKMALGLRKLVDDACEYLADEGDPVELRRAVFTRATEARREGRFDRERVLREVAAAKGVDATIVEHGLYSDLRGEHVLRTAPVMDAATLVDEWVLAREQAVLVTSTRVVCDVHGASPGLLRAFFAKLKFHRLLFAAEKIDGATWRVTLDGPYSMFDAVTKYGLRLALVLPALRALERWSLVADVRWGKAREPLVFRLEGGRERVESVEPHLSDDVRELVESIAKTSWRAEVATEILDVPGAGVCIPDLKLSREGVPPVFVEVLGFWSRDAVWKRVELAALGIGARVVFAVSARLRVSEEVLPDDVPASLYVYKGKMSARALVERVEAVAAR